jgi:thiosulfate dehydrogenase
MRAPAFAFVGAAALLAGCNGETRAPQQGASASGGARQDGPAMAIVRLPTPPESTLKDDPLSRSVRRGRALLAATRDSLPRHVGNDLRCNSCHLDEGTRAYSMPYVGVYARYPQYRSRRGAVELIEERVNDCFVRSMNGRSLDPESRDIRDIVSYFKWLSTGIAVGKRVVGQGIDSIVPPNVPNEARGATVFVTQCARCHGPDGAGAQVVTMPGVYAPPLWGPRSFNIGAGMARLRVTAAFVRSNMPFDKPGTLTPQDAFDVAAFMNGHERPDFAGKENDWPNGDPPSDVTYKTRAKSDSRP